MLWRICLPQVSWYIRCFQAWMRCCLHNRIPQTGYYPATLQKGFPTRPILSSGDMRARRIPLTLRRFWFAGWTRPVTVRFGKRYSSLPLPDVRLSAFYCCDRLFPNIGKKDLKKSPSMQRIRRIKGDFSFFLLTLIYLEAFTASDRYPEAPGVWKMEWGRQIFSYVFRWPAAQPPQLPQSPRPAAKPGRHR